MGCVALCLPLSLAGCSHYDGDLSDVSDGFESSLADSESGDSSSSSGSSSSSSSDSDDDSGPGSAPCDDPCDGPGATACDGDGVVTCVDDEGDGCFTWSEALPCAQGEQCQAGACVIEGSQGFAKMQSWSLPEGGTATTGFSSATGVPLALGDDFWSLLDLNGDGRLDLVVTARAVSQQGKKWVSRTMGYPNNPYWEVYFGEGEGFRDTPVAWPVPSDGLVGHGLITHEGTAEQAGDALWELRDLDGDERLDLVITGRAQAYNGGWLGRATGYPNTPYWEVYRNEGDGFADSPTTWMLPKGGPAFGGYYIADGDPFEVGDPTWEVRDLDADGHPDLIVTGKALSVQDDELVVRALGSLENPYWDIYRGGPKGFAADPEAWLVPMGGYKNGGFARGESKPAKIGDDCWRLRDLNGNGRDDLIITARASDVNDLEWSGKVPGYPGTPHWVVYSNLGDGFARNASTWPVPDGGLSGQGFIDFNGQARAEGDQTWETLDLDGDGQLELVITSQWDAEQTSICRGQVLGFPGEPHWNVFETTARGFAATPWAFDLPNTGLKFCGLRATSGQPLTEGDPAWFTAKLEPDSYPDLIMSAVGLGDPPVQEVFGLMDAPHWQVFRGTP